MASEILQRNPTSTGNRQVHTWSSWVKLNKNSSISNTIYYCASSGSNEFKIQIANGMISTNDYSSSAYQYAYNTDRLLKDYGNWFHLMLAVDTTQTREDDRFKIYVNGVLYSGSYQTETTAGGQNYLTRANTPGNICTIGQNTAGGANYDANCQMTDVFMVDGQALTPDVFGFFKEGKGYQSSGTIQATDFRPGQWSPHSPRKIKTEIERKGGFGVNGFYLPMNDSSNFGADFHCTPNSIITLKGEDLPQPRNGLPTTSDNYVSQLRSDPYAANLVLAVPGVNTQPTGSELITNGTFDTDVSGWTITDTGTIVRQSDGTAKVTRGSSAEVVYQDITTVVGTTYELSVDITDIAGSHGQVYVKSTPHSGSLDTNIGYSFYAGTYKGTFTADTTTTRILLYAHPSGSSSYDNISVKATTIPDYSADIKGSGTNKTLTPYADASVRNPHQRNGRHVNGYYGSALSLDATGDVLKIASHADFNLGNGDYTIEGWYYDQESAINSGSRCYWAIGGVNSDGTLALFRENQYLMLRGKDVGQAYENIIYVTNHNIPVKQWNHICVERVSGRTTLYINGVVLQTTTDTTTVSQGYFTIGAFDSGGSYPYYGYIQDVRVYKGVAKYKGGFDVPKPYAPENSDTNKGIPTWRQVSDTCKNNFATLNPLDAVTSNQSGTDYTQATHSNGNLTVILSDDFSSARGSIGISTGKYYWEIRVDDNYNAVGMGVIAPGNQLTSYSAGANGASYEPRGDRFRKNGVNSYDGTDNKTDDGLIVGVALDKNVGIISFFADGTLLSNGTMTGLNALSDIHIPECFTYNDGSNVDNTYTWNFGQNPTFCGQVTAGTNADASGKGLFKYAPPSGFLALCEDNLPTPPIADPGEHFKTVLWTGDGNVGRSITGVGFQPDFVWIKERNSTSSHELFNSVVGPTLKLNSDAANDESANTNALTSFDSDGFSLGTGGAVNESASRNYVAWCWKAGGAAVSNTDGTITSQVSVNQTAGFSIVSYTGNGSSSATIGHGLNKTPAFTIIKSRDTSSVADWWVYFGSDDYARSRLNLTHPGFSNDNSNALKHAPDTSVFTVTNFLDNNVKYIAYSWAEVEGYSKFGNYVGNGNADGPFVYCGFKPAWVMVKRITSGVSESWAIYDSSRGSTNPNSKGLYANDSAVENDASGRYKDFLSNGFKIRGTSGEQNTNGITYAFVAFAESPFQTANAK